MKIDAKMQDVSSARQRIVAEAVANWTRQLVDLGGRNNLLYFRDLRIGTLDLTGRLDESAGERLLGRQKVRLSQLFIGSEALNEAARRVRTIRTRAIENDEERGLQTLHIGFGLATWRSDRSAATPNAPVLLYRIELTPIGVQGEDFNLEIISEPQVNPSLLYLLEADFGIRDEMLFNGPASLETETVEPDPLMNRIEAVYGSIPGFSIDRRIVVGNFSYAKLPMVTDLERAEAQIAEHALLAAIAGDPEAKGEIRERHHTASELALPVVPVPSDEFLTLDADSSQSRVIAAAVACADVVVIGPPGTGKSQTISNLIATLVARGKSVLFVAEKRAAIEAVIHRLERCELGDLVLDLHDGASNRRRVAGDLARALREASAVLEPDVAKLHTQLERRRNELEAYSAQLHHRSHPWGLSAYEAQQRILGLPTVCQTEVRVHGAALEELTSEVVIELCENASRFVEIGGADARRMNHPLAKAYAAGAGLDTAIVQEALDNAHALQYTLLPTLHGRLREICIQTGLREPVSIQGMRRFLALLRETNSILEFFTPAVFEQPLAEMLPALRPLKQPAPTRLLARLVDSRLKRALNALRACARHDRVSGVALTRATARALKVGQEWRASGSRESAPTFTENLEALTDLLNTTESSLEKLSQATGRYLGADSPFKDLEARLVSLLEQRNAFMRFPELHRLEDGIRAHHLGPALDAAVSRGLSGPNTAQVIEFVWLSSVLEHIYVTQPALATFSRSAQDAAVKEFVTADRAHIETAAGRVRRAWAARTVAARDTFQDEEAQVAKQASLKRGHMPLRDLFDRAEHVLTAVKPCWVMSPLVVAQVLPSRTCFDVVVFDEASQIQPADAVCSLLRGNRAIVAGDPHQLPPTTFFSAGHEDGGGGEERDYRETNEPDEDEAKVAAAREMALIQGQESILDVVRALLPPPQGTRVLSWHYRSRDERLITFSNAQESLYDWSLTTFPGALPGDSISHVLVPYRPSTPQIPASVSDEVDRVVDLVREHAAVRPDESLGIIALGSTHADRIAEALRIAASNDASIAALLDEGQDEHLFVKNLERVQGDERDAVILTVGYGKTQDGRMRYNFGPINQEGGQRRLNVAITRARRRMTVVSSFTGGEMDPERTRSVGARMLRDYLLYAESGGTNLGTRARSRPPLNPFEQDVKEHLEREGMPLIPQFGASGYWIDFAAMHPDRRGEPVLAIETDGVMYHASASARDRDRLRQQHLERLGWCFHRIWSTDWFRSREEEVQKAIEAYRAAVARADGAASLPLEDGDLEDLEWLPKDANDTAAVRGEPPAVRPGRRIADYSQEELRAVVRWVKSDGRLYTEAALHSEARAFLGFSRSGSRISAAIQRAIEAERGA